MKHNKFRVISIVTAILLVFSIQTESFAATFSLPKDYTKYNY